MSSYFNTDLDKLLKSYNIKNLVIVGAATAVCVLETCGYAFLLNYNCIVPREITASFTPERKELGLDLLSFGRSEVVEVKDVYKMLD